MKRQTVTNLTKAAASGKHSVLLPLPVAMHAAIKKRAESEHRSLSAHLRYLIEQDLAS